MQKSFIKGSLENDNSFLRNTIIGTCKTNWLSEILLDMEHILIMQQFINMIYFTITTMGPWNGVSKPVVAYREFLIHYTTILRTSQVRKAGRDFVRPESEWRIEGYRTNLSLLLDRVAYAYSSDGGITRKVMVVIQHDFQGSLTNSFSGHTCRKKTRLSLRIIQTIFYQ